MITVLIAQFSVKIHISYSWEALDVVWASAEARSADPDIAGQKTALIWVSRQIFEIEG